MTLTEIPRNVNWLVVSAHLKNISQNGNLPQIGVKIKNIGNHHLVKVRNLRYQLGGPAHPEAEDPLKINKGWHHAKHHEFVDHRHPPTGFGSQSFSSSIGQNHSLGNHKRSVSTVCSLCGVLALSFYCRSMGFHTYWLIGKNSISQ